MKKLYYVTESLSGQEELCWCKSVLQTAKTKALRERYFGNSTIRIYDATNNDNMMLVCSHRDGEWKEVTR